MLVPFECQNQGVKNDASVDEVLIVYIVLLYLEEESPHSVLRLLPLWYRLGLDDKKLRIDPLLLLFGYDIGSALLDLLVIEHTDHHSHEEVHKE